MIRVALSKNEYRTAERLEGDYWLHVVFNCAGTHERHIVQNRTRLGWQPVMAVERYQLSSNDMNGAADA